MNLAAPQSIEAVLELRNLCRVSLQIVSPQSNCPVIGINQDALVGAYLMTADNVRLTREQFMQLMGNNSNYAYELPAPGDAAGLYTGKQAMSEILPPITASWSDEDGKHEDVRIDDGQLLSGRMHKSQLGGTRGSIVHILMNDYSPAVSSPANTW
jgi:DNA-directed RNA polymerase II subunit RPB1